MRNTQDVIYDMLIIGGGAAGLMLAAGMTLPVGYMPEDGSPSAGKSKGFRGLILEKTSRPGTKLLMTGGGRCNITHAGTMKELLPAYGESGRVLRSILYKNGNLDLLRFLEQQGVRTSTEEDGLPLWRSAPRYRDAAAVPTFCQSVCTYPCNRTLHGFGGRSMCRLVQIWSGEIRIW